jgi:hypothetical protein
MSGACATPAGFGSPGSVPLVHAVVPHETGGREVLRYEEVPDPEPGEGEVPVRGALDSRRIAARHSPG